MKKEEINNIETSILNYIKPIKDTLTFIHVNAYKDDTVSISIDCRTDGLTNEFFYLAKCIDILNQRYVVHLLGLTSDKYGVRGDFFIYDKNSTEYYPWDISDNLEIYNAVKELEELRILWEKMRKLYPKNEGKAFYFNSKFDLKEYPLILPFGGHIRYIPIEVLFNSGPVKTEHATLLISDKYELQKFKTTSEDTEIVKVLVDNLGNFTMPDGITGRLLYNRKVYEDIVLLRKLVKKAWWYNLYLNFKKY